MNAKDGSSSNLESPNEDKKDQKENIENEDENPGEEVVTKTDVTNCDTKSLEGLKYYIIILKHKYKMYIIIACRL